MNIPARQQIQVDFKHSNSLMTQAMNLLDELHESVDKLDATSELLTDQEEEGLSNNNTFLALVSKYETLSTQLSTNCRRFI